MGKAKKKTREQIERERKKERKQFIIGLSISVCVIVIWAVIVFTSKQTTTSAISVQPDSNGDLRIATSLLRNNLTYVDYGGREELMLWKSENGIKTAFDTCESCFPGGNVHFTLNGSILTCSQCHQTQSVSLLGSESWGGCRPISVIPDIRDDTDTEVVLSAAVLSYADRMFSRWDRSDFDITFATYAANE